MVDYFEIPMIVSSDPNAGAQQVSADGSTFYIILDEPLDIPRDAKSVDIQVQEATVWWVIPNVLDSGVEQNNQFTIEEGGNVPFTITVPQGLYDLSALETAVEREVVATGAPAGLFNFISDDPTQKVVIRLNQAGTRIDFTGATTFRNLLGFDSQLVPVALSVGIYTQIGDNVAAFNQIDYFLIHSDLVGRGVRINNTYTQTIAQVLINVPPGSQIVSTPFNPPHSQAPELIGSKRSTIRFWLTDQANNLVNTNNETWSARVVIRYAHDIHKEQRSQ